MFRIKCTEAKSSFCSLISTAPHITCSPWTKSALDSEIPSETWKEKPRLFLYLTFSSLLERKKKRGRQQRETLHAPCTTLHSRSVQQRADSLRATSRAAPQTIPNYFSIVCLCVRYKHFSCCGDLNLFAVIRWRIFVWWGWGKVWFSLNSTGQGCGGLEQ